MVWCECAASSLLDGGSMTGGRSEGCVNTTAVFTQRQLQRLQKCVLPLNGFFLGDFPAVLKGGEGGGSAPWAPALIWRWEADRLAPLPTARSSPSYLWG